MDQMEASQSTAPIEFQPRTADKIAFTVCSAAERMNLSLFKYGFLLLAIEAFLQQEAKALLMLAGGSGLVYILYLAGGFAAQRFTGEFRAMVIASVMIPTGNLLIGWAALTQEGALMGAAVFIGLGLALAGSGFFRVNSVVVVSKVYPEENAVREAAFQALFWAESCGALIAILLAGFLAKVLGWSTIYFIGGGLGIAALLIAFFSLRDHWRAADTFLKPERVSTAPSPLRMIAVGVALAALGTFLYFFYEYMGWVLLACVTLGIIYVIYQFRVAPEPRGKNVSIITLAGVTLAVLVFGLFFEQGVSALVLFSKAYINLSLETPFGSLTLAPNVFIILFCLTAILGAPVISGMLLYLEKRGISCSPVLLISIGIVINSISVLLLVIPAIGSGAGPSSAWWMVASYTLGALSELFALPAAFSLAIQSMPKSRVNAISGIWFLNFGVSGYLGARAAVFVSIDSGGAIPGRETFAEYFGVLGGIGLCVAAVFLVVHLIGKRQGLAASSS